MHGPDRGEHHGDDRGGSLWREPPEQHEQPAHELAEAGDQGVAFSGTEPDRAELRSGPVRTRAAEDAEQLLGAVAHEQEANDRRRMKRPTLMVQ